MLTFLLASLAALADDQTPVPWQLKREYAAGGAVYQAQEVRTSNQDTSLKGILFATCFTQGQTFAMGLMVSGGRLPPDFSEVAMTVEGAVTTAKVDLLEDYAGFMFSDIVQVGRQIRDSASTSISVTLMGGKTGTFEFDNVNFVVTAAEAAAKCGGPPPPPASLASPESSTAEPGLISGAFGVAFGSDPRPLISDEAPRLTSSLPPDLAGLMQPGDPSWKRGGFVPIVSPPNRMDDLFPEERSDYYVMIDHVNGAWQTWRVIMSSTRATWECFDSDPGITGLVAMLSKKYRLDSSDYRTRAFVDREGNTIVVECDRGAVSITTTWKSGYERYLAARRAELAARKASAETRASDAF